MENPTRKLRNREDLKAIKELRKYKKFNVVYTNLMMLRGNFI
jgi:hypothetical protein